MIWHVLAVVLLCFTTLDNHVAGQLDDLSLFSYDSFTENGPEATSSNNVTAEMDVFRLPTDVFPLAYGLEVATDFADLTYTGRVEIVVRTVTAVCQIVLNAKDLLVTGVKVIDQKSNESLKTTDSYLMKKNEQLIIQLNKTVRCLIPSRSYVVKVEFGASLRNDMSGYYKSSYKENNETKWLAVTKFEPTHARKAFPCFDEPAFKVPFKVSLRRRSGQISLSNMPLLSSTKIFMSLIVLSLIALIVLYFYLRKCIFTSDKDEHFNSLTSSFQKTNMYWDHFQETPPISTYLVAFFVGEFFAMKSRTIGIYTHKSYVNQAEYIANKSPMLLEAMENFTGVDYSLPKLDLLAIPDFAAGAMENWGLNTYRERLLLLHENSKTKTKEFVTTVVGHELSHQWFGDLVTCAWWDYLWLNEGFATYFEYFATKLVEPDWRLEDVFVYEVHQDALNFDQYPTHPITGSVKTLAQIKGMFDDISYSKAGAVLRMLQYTVTENNFKNALNLYLENNKYHAATPDDLWIAFETILFEEEFDLDDSITITKFMKSWTEQAGYPLVYIMKENNSLVVSQERFLVETSIETNNTIWVIGLTYTTESKKDFNGVIPKIFMNEKQIILPNQTETGWYIFNLQSIGFYRVNYEVENWNALINQLHKDCGVIHVLNRAQLIDDVFNLALANQVDYNLALGLSKYLINEHDVVPYYSAKNVFAYILERMRRCPHNYKYVKSYVGYLAELIYTNVEDLVVNHNSSEHHIMTGWNTFSNWACKLDNEICTKSALSYFELWRQGIEIPADIKDAAFCIGVKNGNWEVWNSILDIYVNSESPSLRQSAQWALACSTDPVQLTKYLDFMFDGYNAPIRPQDFRVIYQTIPSTPIGISVMTNFLTNKLNRIVKEVINGEIVVTSMYSILASRVALKDEILKIDNLRYNLSVPEYLREKFNSSYGIVEDNLEWFHSYHSKIGEWSKTTVYELKISETPSTSPKPMPGILPKTSTIPPINQAKPSSSVSVNCQKCHFILSIIFLILLVTRFNF